MFFPLTIHHPLTYSLGDRARSLGLTIGSCADVSSLKSNADAGQYIAALRQTVDMIEPENELKPMSIWKGIDQYDFTSSDFLLGSPGHKGWCAQNHMKVRGHVLVYANDRGYTMPKWLLAMESKISSEEAKKILHEYIHTVVSRYKGKIAMWDVVNEAIDDAPNSRPFNLRDTFFFRKLGAQFLVLAFKYAHEADPKAELYYNEYGFENGGAKRKHVTDLAEYLLKSHAPITGIGMQYHLTLPETVTPGDGHYQTIQKIAALKLKFMITELDIAIDVKKFPRTDPLFGNVPAKSSDLAIQAERYASVFKMALSFPNCHGIQMWGVTDKHSWIPGFSVGHGAALTWDYNYVPKPAYDSILDVLASYKK